MNENSMPDLDGIIAGLSESDIEALKKAAQDIFGEQEGKERQKQAPPTAGGFADILGNAEMLAKISAVMNAMNAPDARADLIAALKPLLSEPRQRKADEAIKMLRLLELMPMLQKEFGEKGD